MPYVLQREIEESQVVGTFASIIRTWLEEGQHTGTCRLRPQREIEGSGSQGLHSSYSLSYEGSCVRSPKGRALAEMDERWGEWDSGVDLGDIPGRAGHIPSPP